MDSEYSPVCSDIEDQDEVSENQSNDEKSSTPDDPTVTRSSDILRLLDECTRDENVLEDVQQSDDDETEICKYVNDPVRGQPALGKDLVLFVWINMVKTTLSKMDVI